MLIKHHNAYLVEVTEELHDEGDGALGSERGVRLTEQVAYHLHVATDDLYFGVVEAVTLLPQLPNQENHEVHDLRLQLVLLLKPTHHERPLEQQIREVVGA